jgi:excisionase family DNA binding protein
MTTALLPELMTEEQLADYLQVSVSRIRYWRQHAGLPYLKLGKVIRFLPQDVQQWLSTCQQNNFTSPLRRLT